MKKSNKTAVAAFIAALLACVATLASCGGGGDTLDGKTTERIALYTDTEAVGVSRAPTELEEALYGRIKEYFDVYYGKVEHTTTFDPAERGNYGGDECYVFRSQTKDGGEGFLIAASTDGKSAYGYEPATELFALIWCEGWTAPDFSYFGEKDISGL